MQASHESVDPALDATVEARLTALGPGRATFDMSPGSTIVPPMPEGESTRRRILELGEEIGVGTSSALDLEGTLGEGGMGLVRLGTQRSLGRKVAVKTLRKEARDGAVVAKLLREAWVMGALEHPNILPIHDVRRDEQGQPLVILKLIEGVDWGTVIHDAEAVASRFGQTDLFEHNLGVLMEVCQAVAFAHSRGIIHRDIKPDNVRLGSFGEVYLIDWGLGLSVRPDPSGRLPLANQARELAGTPSYMAPEMLGGVGMPPLSERTDVYLLGATLYEIVAGRPPHAREGAAAIVKSVLHSDPAIPDHTPLELGQIIRRAMAADPENRYADAEELRVALEEYRAHRGSSRLCMQADARVEEITALLGDPADNRVRAYDLFGAGRTGYQSALELWPMNLEARDGLRSLQLDMVDYELARGDARAAQALCADISGLPDETEQRIRDGLRAQESEERRLAALEELGRENDPHVGRRTRVGVGAGFIGFWGVVPVVLERLGGAREQTYRETTLVMVGALAMIAALGFWGRDSLTKTALNRRIVATLFFTMSAHFVVIGGAWLMGLDVPRCESLFFLLWMTVSAGLTIHVERKLWPMIVLNLGGFLVASWRPDLRHWVMCVTNLLIAVNIFVAWPARAEQAPRSRAP